MYVCTCISFHMYIYKHGYIHDYTGCDTCKARLAWAIHHHLAPALITVQAFCVSRTVTTNFELVEMPTQTLCAVRVFNICAVLSDLVVWREAN